MFDPRDVRLTAITSYLHFLSKLVYLVFGFFQFHSNVSASMDIVAAMINRGAALFINIVSANV